MPFERTKARYTLLIPAILYAIALTVFPLIYTVYLSITNYSFGNPVVEIVGVDNYVRIFQDYRVSNSFRVTLFITAIAVPIELMLGLILAVLAGLFPRFQGVFRTIFLIPLFSTPVAIALMGPNIFYEEGGPVNGLLMSLGFPKIYWLSDPKIAIWTVILLDIWQWTPFVFLITLAGLQGIPAELYESAMIDGASGYQVFRRITLPQITPILLTVFFFRFVDCLKIYDVPFVMLGGGPGTATETFTIYIYKLAFRGFNFGYSSALSVIFLVIVMIAASILIRRLSQYYV